MSKRWGWILCVLVVCFTMPLVGGDGNGPIVVLEPGSFHGDEVPTGSAGRWLALGTDGGKFAWRAVSARVKREHDDIIDEDSAANTGKNVQVNGAGEIVLMLRGLESIANSRVVASISKERVLGPHDEIVIELPGKTYRLNVTGTVTEEEGIGKGSILRLSNGDVQQVLFSLPNGGNDPHWSLLWAGDLDGDGKLDLYLDLSDHYNVSNHMLFLSSRAPKGKLVRRVASLRRTGC